MTSLGFLAARLQLSHDVPKRQPVSPYLPCLEPTAGPSGLSEAIGVAVFRAHRDPEAHSQSDLPLATPILDQFRSDLLLLQGWRQRLLQLLSLALVRHDQGIEILAAPIYRQPVLDPRAIA